MMLSVNSLIILIIVSACGSTNFSQSNLKMFNGQILNDENPGQFSAVAIKSDIPTYGVCSGVLVAENLIVTAAHCVYSPNIGFDFRNITKYPSYIHFTADTRRTPISHVRKIVKVEIHPDYNQSISLVLNDIAWIKFDGSIPSGYKPIPVLKDLNKLSEFHPLLFVGYGLTEIFSSDQRLFSEGVFLRHYGIESQWAGVITSSLKVQNSGPCWGDSGGPLYVSVENKWYAIGVLNGNTNIEGSTNLNCGNGHNAHNSLGVHSKWLESSSGVSLVEISN